MSFSRSRGAGIGAGTGAGAGAGVGVGGGAGAAAVGEDVGSSKGVLAKRKDFLGVDQLADSHPNRTYYYRKNNDLDDIIDTCSKKLQRDPRNAQALFLRGSSLTKKRAFDEGIRDFDILIALQPFHVEGLYNRAVAFTKIDQQERAIEDLTRVLKINPDHINAAFARAACYNKIGQFVKAIEDYNFALMKDESNADDSNLGGGDAGNSMLDDFSSNGLDASRLALHSEGDGEISPNIFNRQITTSGGSDNGEISPISVRSSGKFSNYHQYSPMATPTVASSNSLFGRDKPSQLKQQQQLNSSYAGGGGSVVSGGISVAGSVRSSVNSAQADEHHARGYALRKANDFQGAVAEYTLAIAADPCHFKALFNRGFAHDKLGMFELAIADYTRAIEIDASNSFCYYNRGISHDRNGALESALVDFDKAINLQPSNPEFYHNRAFCLRKLSRFEEAIDDYSMSLELSPNNFKALYNRASCYDQLQQLELSLLDCDAALAVQPTHGACLLLRATVLEKLQELPQALAAVNTALLNSADAFSGYSERAKILGRMGNFSDSIRDLNAALGLQPNNISLLFSRGVCYKSTEQYELAVADFSAVIAQDPSRAVSHNHLGYCNRKLERFEAALENYTTCIELSPENVRAHNNRAYILAKLERYAEAIEDYSIVLKLEPRNVQAYHNRGVSYDKMGLIDQALSDFSKVLELEPPAQLDGGAAGSSGGQGNREVAAAAMQAIQQQQQLQLQLQQRQLGMQGSLLATPQHQPQQSHSSTQQSLLSAQALLSQLPTPKPFMSTPSTPAQIKQQQPLHAQNAASSLGGVPMQSGSFFVPRGHAGVSAQPAAHQPLSSQQSQQQLTPQPQSQIKQSATLGSVRATPKIVARMVPAKPIRHDSSRHNSEQDGRGTDTPPEEDDEDVDGESGHVVAGNASSIADTRLADRLNQVSNLLKGFGVPPDSPHPTGAQSSTTTVSSATNGRSTTPMSYQFARRAAQNASTDSRSPNETGMRATSAGVVDSPSDSAPNATPAPRIALPYKSTEPASAGRPSYYRAPVPVSQQPQQHDIDDLVGPARVLPVALKPPPRVKDNSQPLSIDTKMGTPGPGRPPSALSCSGSHSSVDSAEAGAIAPTSSTKSAPLSATMFLNSLRKPLPAVGNQQQPSLSASPSSGSKFEAFSPSPSPGSYSISTSTGNASIGGRVDGQQQQQPPPKLLARGKFSHY